MNGNDLNNMANRYKEEMMQLYRRSGSCPNVPNSQSVGSMKTDCIQQKNIPGTSIPATMQSSHVREQNIPQQNMQQQSMPQQSMPQQSMPQQSMPQQNMPKQSPPMECTPQPAVMMPRQNENMTMQSGNPFPSAESIINSITEHDDMMNQCAEQDSSDNSLLRSIVINMTPEDAAYTMPSPADEASDIFPDFRIPADLPADSAAIVPDTRNFFISDLWISLTGDRGWGFFQAEVYTSGGEYPVPNAVVIVRRTNISGISFSRVLVTNQRGLTPTIALPAPNIMLPTTEGIRAFATYSITVVAQGYYTLRNVEVPIYAGSKFVQPIDMIPITSTPIQPRSDGCSTVG